MDLETKTLSLNSSRPANANKRLESRIEELRSQLSRAAKDSSGLKTGDKGAREVTMQLQEGERQRSRLEEEVKSYENRIKTMRESMDEMVGNILNVGFFSLICLILPFSKIPRPSSSWSNAGQNAKRLIIEKKL